MMSLRQSRVELLPNELKDYIISLLSTDPPSSAKLHLSPSPSIVNSEARDLKNLSLVSSCFCELVRPFLFLHVCFDLESENDFLSFITRSELGKYVKSIVVIGGDLPYHKGNLFWWRRILRYLDPLRVTAVAPALSIGEMLGLTIRDEDIWAFDIPYQIVHLVQDSRHGGPAQSPQLEDQESLLSCRPWTSLLFNEASSLKPYSHYEYFHLCAPSMFNIKGSLASIRPERQWTPMYFWLDTLTSFHYTAIFPFYNHVAKVLGAIEMMTKLESLSVQLTPDRGDNVEIEQKGSLDPSDPWMEIETGYSLFANAVSRIGCTRPLRKFVARDYVGLQSELSDIVGVPFDLAGWVHDGRGTWTKMEPST